MENKFQCKAESFISRGASIDRVAPVNKIKSAGVERHVHQHHCDLSSKAGLYPDVRGRLKCSKQFEVSSSSITVMVCI